MQTYRRVAVGVANNVITSMSTVTAFYDVQKFPLGFPRKHSNIWKSYGSQSEAHLAVLGSSPVSANQFHLSLWASTALCMIMSFTYH